MLSEVDIFSLGLFNISVGLLYIFYCSNRMISKKSILLLPVSSSIFVITNFLSISFLPQIFGEEYNKKDILLNSSISVFLFVIVCLATQLIFDNIPQKNLKKKKYYPNNGVIYSYSATYFFYILMVIVIFGFIRFVFFSGGINYIGTILLESGDFYDYNLARLDVGKLLNSLPGAGLAGMSLQFLYSSIVSCLFILLIRSKKRNKLFYKVFIFFLIAFVLLANLVLAMIFAKKAMLIYVFIYPLVMFAIARNQKSVPFKSFQQTAFYIIQKNNVLSKEHAKNPKSLKDKLKKSFIIVTLLLLLLIVVGLVYSVSQGGNVSEIFLIAFQRIFVVPAQTNAFYFGLFPSIFPFRGLDNLLGFSGRISYQDVAQAFTGYRFTSNASFVTIAYSAGSFFAVILVSFLYSILTLIHDIFFKKQEGIFKTFIFISSVNGVYAICSAPLDTSIINFGYLLPTLICLLCLKKSK